MIPTPQFDEALEGAVVTADVIDDLKDQANSGEKINLVHIFGAVAKANKPLSDGIMGIGAVGEELKAALADEETAGEVGRKIGVAIHRIYTDLQDPNS